MFADDCLIFMKINSSTIKAFRDVLKCYELFSGQTVNYGKSEVAVSKNCLTNIHSDLAHILRVSIVPHLSKYLGLLLQCHRKKTETFLPIIEKLQNRVHSWQNCKLSIGGKEVLISAVLNALPQYWLAIFLLPESIIQKIQSVILSFWWSTGPSKRGVHWVKQDTEEGSRQRWPGFPRLAMPKLSFFG
ncbi:hypothetical protein QQ045_016487 [Rhodiola kirilowii]